MKRGILCFVLVIVGGCTQPVRTLPEAPSDWQRTTVTNIGISFSLPKGWAWVQGDMFDIEIMGETDSYDDIGKILIAGGTDRPEIKKSLRGLTDEVANSLRSEGGIRKLMTGKLVHPSGRNARFLSCEQEEVRSDGVEYVPHDLFALELREGRILGAFVIYGAKATTNDAMTLLQIVGSLNESCPNNGPSVQMTRDVQQSDNTHGAGSSAPQP